MFKMFSSTLCLSRSACVMLVIVAEILVKATPVHHTTHSSMSNVATSATTNFVWNTLYESTPEIGDSASSNVVKTTISRSTTHVSTTPTRYPVKRTITRSTNHVATTPKVTPVKNIFHSTTSYVAATETPNSVRNTTHGNTHQVTTTAPSVTPTAWENTSHVATTVSCSCDLYTLVCAIESAFIVVLLLVILILIQRLGCDKKSSLRALAQNDTEDGKENKVLMDLQEREPARYSEGNTLEILPSNVRLLTQLSGTSRIQYYKALIVKANGQQDVIVKTFAADSTKRISRLLHSEVQQLLKLPMLNQNSIVKIIGWCDTVPSYIIFEHIRGGNLSDYLKEEFCPHKIHLYDNVKKKSFQVAEKGNFEILPVFALQVARGLRFLLNNKFIHPGLRARKILLDTGTCKLYDFVSLENASEWTRMVWKDTSVPFQWMPPEFLFSESLSPAGDIWSFGVLLWELFSYGTEPYIGQTRYDVELNLYKNLLLPIPDNCPMDIWQLMTSCWEPAAEKRPKLDDVHSKLSSIRNEDDEEYEQV